MATKKKVKKVKKAKPVKRKGNGPVPVFPHIDGIPIRGPATVLPW